MIRLEPLSPDHLPHIMTWVNDLSVMQYFANRQEPISDKEEAVYINYLIGSKTDLVFSIFDDAEYVGQCSINQIYWPAKNGRLFIVIRKQSQGNGYASEALKKLIEMAWGELQLHKIWLIVRQDNHSAQAMYLSLGFNFEGLLRDEYHVQGRYFDMVRMGILNPNG